ncbi:hypothetical protein EYZ11_010965 [Aspergillus tanneri]|uniref:Uncharacterized protein n=1 Tax=Aspergillus tanneri TaxID=1220188 RepID=A0A4S3J4C0_9EURO|nr:hypothetical protein EYZ11_010965 [Aspergillus tanneri]
MAMSIRVETQSVCKGAVPVIFRYSAKRSLWG